MSPLFSTKLGEVTTYHTLFWKLYFLFSFGDILKFGSCKVLSLGVISAYVESYAMFIFDEGLMQSCISLFLNACLSGSSFVFIWGYTCS